MDVKFSFLHGDLHEEIYMEKPPEFIQRDSSLACQLKKSLYGLKKAPQAWYVKMDSFLLDIVFSRYNSNDTVYTKKVGKLLYLTHTHPKLSFVVGLISRFMQNPHEIHWKEAKRILRYVRGYVFTLGSGPITWACKKQSDISLSSAEAEYRGIVEDSKEALWLRKILSKFGFQQQHPNTLWCDNQSSIQL
eukprot:PITA_28831